MPTFCGRPELVKQVFERYQQLQAQGSKVLLMSKYWVNDFVSVAGTSPSASVQSLLANAAEGQPKPLKDIELADCILQLK